MSVENNDLEGLRFAPPVQNLDTVRRFPDYSLNLILVFFVLGIYIVLGVKMDLFLLLLALMVIGLGVG